MSTLIARLVVKVITWAQFKTHTYNISKFTGISQKATIGVNCVLNIPVNNFFIGDYTYLNEVHLTLGKKAKVITHSKDKLTNNISGNIQH
ncbi:galactoside O-acetyltransferase, partial [Acinetobacter baumannii]|nr:galactoside O-acetyltransferase [Acinetobacter baumannii]